VLSLAEGKAAALLTRGAYSQYVSTAQRARTPLAAFFNIPIIGIEFVTW